MVRFYHAIFTAYGFWLPNDPRGSWSDFVGSWELYKFGGPATKTTERRSLAHDVHDIHFRREAKLHLKRPPVRFDESQRNAIGDGFARVCSENGVVLHACCVGFDHVHVIAARHRLKSIEQIVGLLKGRATQAMRAGGVWDLIDQNGVAVTPWAEGCWKVFIDDDAHAQSAIRYVERHPEKEGLAPQRWEFVTPLTG